MKEVVLDRTDQRILALLERDARKSYSSIGRDVGLSRTAVQERVSRLESNGTIGVISSVRLI
ncbi:MAG: AsnC family transcriptional regulator, partial [Pseudomonadota bacterium]